jgi:hypothetical protein
MRAIKEKTIHSIAVHLYACGMLRELSLDQEDNLYTILIAHHLREQLPTEGK